MKLGTSRVKVDFDRFKVIKFVPHLFGNSLYATRGCGASTLSLLTGENPFNIERRTNWTPGFMCKFLLKREFRVQPLTLRNIANFRVPAYPIGTSHVIMMSCMMRENEASWVVIHNDVLFHNFEVQPLTSYELVNHPVVSAFLVSHDSWNESGRINVR